MACRAVASCIRCAVLGFPAADQPDGKWHLLPYASGVAVLVVAAEPELPAVALVAALGHPVQDRVVAHQELHPPPGGRIALIDDAVLEGKDAHHRRLRQ